MLADESLEALPRHSQYMNPGEKLGEAVGARSVRRGCPSDSAGCVSDLHLSLSSCSSRRVGDLALHRAGVLSPCRTTSQQKCKHQQRKHPHSNRLRIHDPPPRPSVTHPDSGKGERKTGKTTLFRDGPRLSK